VFLTRLFSARIHLAGLSNDPTAEFNPKANFEINTKGTSNLANLCKKAGIRRFIFASTCSIYDRGLYAEDVIQNEDSPVQPRAAYAVSKYEAERILLDLTDKDFSPTIFRQGTVYGFSRRMRYDLVVNTFVKSAMTTGKLVVFCGGEMWRPLIDVVDVARAYICALESEEETIRGRIFNLSYKNYRILELAHWVRKALRDLNFEKDISIEVDYSDRKARSYRVATKKLETVLGFHPEISVEDSVTDMVKKLMAGQGSDFQNPRYYNIDWMSILADVEEKLKKWGSVF
jgi:nucleoside-diphosphate-sugar epimerase